ncbi:MULTISPECIES: hypothetical protein [unclassified Wenzhouxiangella]|uniref:hypothetical protein n=1 Tax=unclassified Wenzhouxiangella TaxID=2613841 RepID=UPI0011C061CF|nr:MULTISPECIES: hypothetical protein [unclassified Wenzhouxiangella]
MKKTICILSVAFLAIGCGTDEQPPPEETTQAAQEESADDQREIVRRDERQQEEEPESLRDRDADPEKKIPRIDGSADEEGYGLTMVVDGSSPEAFQESLELIAMDTSKDQYRQLDSALRFLGTYDTAAWKGLPNLYKTLDGMTGEEIIERAANMREERSN